MIVAWTGDKLLYWQAKNGINLDLQVKFDIEDQGQSTPQTIGFLTVLRCISGPNLVILTLTSEKLSCGQAKNEVKFDFQVKFDLEGEGRSPPKIISILTKVFCVSHPNLVILAWTAELSCGQASDWYTHTDAGDDNTRRPKLASGKKLIEDTKLTPINTQERTYKWTRQNRKNPTEKSVIDYILVSKEYERSIEEITVDEMGIYRIKGKVDSDHNTINTTITSNLTTKRTFEITQNQQQRGMEGVQQRNNQVV